MAQKQSSNKEMSINSEVVSVLHELMYAPGGSVNYSSLLKKLGTGSNNDVKKLTLYCFQQAYVEYDGESLQLTDAGMHHYLSNQRMGWV